IVGSMKQKGLPVTYVLYPDEGHGFARPQNRLSFYAITEGFLAQCLGGGEQGNGGGFAGARGGGVEGGGERAGGPRGREGVGPSPEARMKIPKPPTKETSK